MNPVSSITFGSFIRSAAVAVCITSGFAAPAAFAQSDFPNKPIRMVVGFALAGSTNIGARSLAQKPSEGLGVPVVVENRPGANGTVARAVVAQAAPDGYTVMMGEIGSLAMAPGLYPRLPYDPVRDFIPMSLVARTPPEKPISAC